MSNTAEHGYVRKDQKLLALALTVAASFVIVPVVFFLSALAWWNIAIPAIEAGNLRGKTWNSRRFVYRLTMPFVNSVTVVCEVYGYMNAVTRDGRIIDLP